MSVSIVFNGVTFPIPDTGEESWGESLSAYLEAIADGCLQNTGGAFTLTANVNFGSSYGLLSKFYSTRSSSVATSGNFRLARTDTISFRNAADSANLDLTVDSSNRLTFDGTAIYTGGITALTGDVTATGPGSVAATIASNVIVNSMINSSAAIAYSKLSLTGSVVNADISASAAIDFSKLATLTSANILVGNGSNVAASVAMSGDITISNAGVTAIGSGKVTNSMLATASSAATASYVVLRDSNANISANNVLDGYTTTATAAGTTTLTVSSTRLQYFTGSTTQTVSLPVTSTLVLGQQFQIVNNSSGAVTVNSSGGNEVQVMAASSIATVTCILTSGTSAASWSVAYSTSAAGGGSVTSVAMTVPSFLSVSGSPVTTSGTLALSLSGTALPVTSGGTGIATTTAYGVITGGTTSTGNFQNAGAGTAGQTLCSRGASTLPLFRGPVAASAYSSANNDIGTGQSGNYDTIVYDTDSAVTAASAGTGTWKFTAPFTGYYRITVNMFLTTVAQPNIHVYKNGSDFATMSGCFSGGNGTAGYTILLSATDYIDIRTSSSLTQAGGAITASASNIQIEMIR